MIKHTEVMKLALEALECTEYPQDHYDAITAPREALELVNKVDQEQPAPQEPTKAAEMVDALLAKYSDKLYDAVGPHDAAKFEEDCNHIKQTLAPQPPQRTWVGLTNEEKLEAVKKFRDTPVALVFDIEAKLKEKNT